MSTSSAPTIGTHDGHFHADEALAVYLLRLLPIYANAPAIRTRDPSLLARCTIVVDVGGEHDHGALRYDHHQRGFEDTFPEAVTKLSSAGLVWMHYGMDIVRVATGLVDEADLQILWRKIYEDFVEAFDANDNGISVYDSSELKKAGIKRKFADKGFSLAGVVNRFNYLDVSSTPSDSAAESIEDYTPTAEQKEQNARFDLASSFVGQQFHIELTHLSTVWLPARALVASAFAERHAIYPSGAVLLIPPTPTGGAPWSDHLYALERENGVVGQVLYVLFAESGEPNAKWRVRAVGVEEGGFECRKALPEVWRGLRDAELSEKAGIEGCVFVHASGFIGGNVTREGVVEMARRAAEM